jgi:hypothetical protein
VLAFCQAACRIDGGRQEEARAASATGFHLSRFRVCFHPRRSASLPGDPGAKARAHAPWQEDGAQRCGRRLAPGRLDRFGDRSTSCGSGQR